MRPAAKILKKIRRGAQGLAYGNPLYQKILSSGDDPECLHFTLPDPWPGDAQAGLALMSGQRSMFEKDTSVSLRSAATALRNLRAVGTELARHMALQLIGNWLQHHNNWSTDEWAPDILGERIAAWIGFYEFYAFGAAPEFTAHLTSSLHRQYKHLLRAVPSTLTGIAGIRAIKGLVYGGLNFPDGDKALGLALDLLKRQLGDEILPDGGHVSRSPSTQLHMLRHLIDLRAALRAAGVETPDIISASISIMLPVIKFYRHGDGGLALFHGGVEETPLLIDAVLTQSEARSRVLRRLPETSYERITAGRSLLITDCGRPPPRGYDASGHAGLLAFEFGQGRERLIVNCGTVVGANAEWRRACAATAAHSTLTVEDTNACEIGPSGSVTPVIPVQAQRYEQDKVHFVEMIHDGYRSKFYLTHRRILGLSEDGDELRGCETLQGATGKNFTLRWHLHPDVQASLIQNGNAALLLTPSGGGWRLRVENGGLEMESGIYCGSGVPRRSLQLKTRGQTVGETTDITWSLTREKRK